MQKKTYWGGSGFKDLRSIFLRGGRMTKWKGVVASIAPVISTVAVPLMLVGAMTLGGTGNALALEPGGPFVYGVGVTCNNDGDPPTDTNAGYAVDGIRYGNNTTGGGVLTVDGTTNPISYTTSTNGIQYGGIQRNTAPATIRVIGPVSIDADVRGITFPYSEGTLTIESSASITAGLHAVWVDANPVTDSDAITVVLSGPVSSTGATGVHLSTGLTQGYDGPDTRSGMSITLTSTSSISSTYNGVVASSWGGDITVTVEDVTGGTTGVLAESRRDAWWRTLPETGNVNVSVNGNITGGSGYAIDTRTGYERLSAITVNSSSIVSASSGLAISNNEGNSATTIAAGARVSGAINLSTGDDELYINGADISNITLMNGGDDYGTGDGFIDTLYLNDVTATANGADIINWENVIVDRGTMSFADHMLQVGADVGTGMTITGGGVVDGGSMFTLTGNMMVNADGTFQGQGGGAGIYEVTGMLTNSGIMTMQDDALGDVLTADSDYSGTGQLLVDSNVDTLTSDMLVIEGDVTDGSTAVGVNSLGSVGSSTGTGPGAGIAVVDVSATGNTADGDFLLSGGPFTVGAFSYDLNLETDGIWYLQSLYLPQVPTYEAYPQTLLGMLTLPTMQQRIGNRWNFMTCDGVPEASLDGSAIWSRVETGYAHVEPKTSTTGVLYEQNLWRVHVGSDFLLHESEDGSKVFAGLTGHYGSASTDVESAFGDGSISTTGYGLGGTLTWLGSGGFYVDAQGSATWFDSDLSSDVPGSLVKDNDGFGYVLSAEAGMKLPVRESWTVTPQAQLSYASVDFDGFSGPNGESVSLPDEAESLKLRLGIAADRDCSWTNDNGVQRYHLYAVANVYREFRGKSVVEVSGTTFESKPYAWTGELGVGFTRNFDNDRYSLYGEATAATGLKDIGDSYRFGATAGLRIKI